jgi:hypothetical protein
MGDKPYANPRVAVRLADGAEWTAQSLNPDLLRYERAAAKHKWPTPSASPVWWMTFLAWSAGQREGHILKSVTWEEFSEDLCVEVRNPDAAGAVAVPPTVPVPDTD